MRKTDNDSQQEGGEERALSLVAIQRYVFHTNLAFFSSFNVKYGNVYVTSDIPWHHKIQKDARSEDYRHMRCDVT